MVTLSPEQPVSDEFRAAVGAVIDAFLSEQSGLLAGLSPETIPLLDRARTFTTGGKRLRPAFAAWAWTAITGEVTLPDALLAAISSLDVLHVSALMHDDVMDASDARRGVPAAHRQFEADHRAAGGRGDPEAFGRAGGVLLGDLLLVWSAEMFRRSGLDADAQARAYPHLETVRTEVTAGQYLDVVAQAQDPYPLTRTPQGRARLAAMIGTVVTWKSASYTVRRPLLIGAAAAGGTEAQLAALSSFGEPLGRAFQYRDDVLGVFGDEALTGKETGEDLREGKLTLLAAEAFGRAQDDDAAELATLFGDPALRPDQVDRARSIIADSGALDAVETEIRREHDAALAALADAPLTGPGRDGLTGLASLAVSRSF